MRPIRKQKIYRTCQKVLAKWGGKNLPVVVEEIANQHGIKVRDVSLPDSLSGFIHRRVDESTVIGVNEKLENHSRRWVIAHELGHFFLHSGEYHVTQTQPGSPFLRHQNVESFSSTNPEEVEANIFAAELLMPEDKIHEMLLTEAKIDTKRLAKTFDVDTLMMENRLVALGYVVLRSEREK